MCLLKGEQIGSPLQEEKERERHARGRATQARTEQRIGAVNGRIGRQVQQVNLQKGA
ncbi:hypothetical protein LM604_06350 [Candidatus Acetothermia bacterium]|nr:hypothetical protein [Candidatus Acetothermia bacterium]